MAEEVDPAMAGPSASSETVRPEFSHALAILVAAISQQGPWIRPPQLKAMGHCPPTNFMALSEVPFYAADIPSEEWWAWNQSGKTQTYPCNGMCVRMVKYMPRLKRRQGQRIPVPHYKAWIMAAMGADRSFHFVWLERGQIQDLSSTLGNCFNIAIPSPEAPAHPQRGTWAAAPRLPQLTFERHNSAPEVRTATRASPCDSLTLNDLSFLLE